MHREHRLIQADNATTLHSTISHLSSIWCAERNWKAARNVANLRGLNMVRTVLVKDDNSGDCKTHDERENAKSASFHF